MKITDLRSPETAVDAAEVRNTWVLPEQRIVFTSIGKNACTSIKWLLAEISGQDFQRFIAHPSAEPTRRMLVHNRRMWQHTPRLSEMSEAERREVSPANGWFVFAVVRDPRLRLFSAWQSKFLVGDPSYFHRKWAGSDWLPRTPRSADDVLTDWATFVGVIERSFDRPAPTGDGHFAPQTQRLQEALVPYSRVYEIRELGQLTSDLSEHLKSVTGSAPALTLSRENDTPLAAGREVFADGIQERIERHYAVDFERFGDLWPFDKTMSTPISFSDDALNDIAARRAIHERLADLRDMVRDANREVIALRRSLRTAERQRDAADRALRDRPSRPPEPKQPDPGRPGPKQAPTPAEANSAQGGTDAAETGNRPAADRVAARGARMVRRARRGLSREIAARRQRGGR